MEETITTEDSVKSNYVDIVCSIIYRGEEIALTRRVLPREHSGGRFESRIISGWQHAKDLCSSFMDGKTKYFVDDSEKTYFFELEHFTGLKIGAPKECEVHYTQTTLGADTLYAYNCIYINKIDIK